jgi:Kef-type K+ transport system membrane component KefB
VGITILFSYLLDKISKLIRVPAVILLLFTGIVLKEVLLQYQIDLSRIVQLLPLFGTLALLLIVLEGSLDLTLSKEKIGLIFKTMLSALLGILVGSIGISVFLFFAFDCDFYTALVNAIPFSVISSAVAIPSTLSLSTQDREFIIYESTFSDILGILFFSFLIDYRVIDEQAFAHFGLSVLITLLISVTLSIVLIYFLGRIKQHIKFLPIFGSLLIAYSSAKIFHFSPLLIIFVFGLLLNNVNILLNRGFRRIVDTKEIDAEIHYFKGITAESVFLARTVFFIVFGYSIDISGLGSFQTIFITLIIFSIIFIFRIIRLWFITKKNSKTLLFFAPRGLITVLLFISIPSTYRLPFITQSTVILTILLSIFLMVIGLWTMKIPLESVDSEDL